MNEIVRKILSVYLSEKRTVTPQELSSDANQYVNMRDAVFVTLYHGGDIIASSGRIQCKRENTLQELIENTLLCLKDSRFSEKLQSPEELLTLKIRVDRFAPSDRRVLASIQDLNISKEWLIFLSQKYGAMSVLLPNIVNIASTPEQYLDLVIRKAELEPSVLTAWDYIIYGLKTIVTSDF